jgi:hypothetical protein
MPIIKNNNVTHDTFNERAERLSAIQGNLTSIQSELQAPAYIISWAENCYDLFMDLHALYGYHRGRNEGNTLNVNDKARVMEVEYQNVKTLALSIYRDDRVNLKDFGFDEPYPIRTNEKVPRINKVLQANERHIAAGVTNLLPDSLITRLMDAKNDFEAALLERDNDKTESEHTLAELKKRFDDDTAILQELRAWWYIKMGKNDGRIGIIEMVNPKPTGRGRSIETPVDFIFDEVTSTFSWSPVNKATSYQIQRKMHNDFVEIYTGTETFFKPSPADLKGQFKIRARYRRGYGNFSELLEI